MKFEEIIQVYEHVSALKKFTVPIGWNSNYGDALLYLGQLNTQPEAIATWDEIVKYQFYQMSLHIITDWDKIVADDYQNLDMFIDFLKKNSKDFTLFLPSWVLAFWAKVIETDKKDAILPHVAEFLQIPEVKYYVQNFYSTSAMQYFFKVIMVAEAEFYITQKRKETYFYSLFEWLYKLREHYPQVISEVMDKLSEVSEQADFSIKEVKAVYSLFEEI